MSGRTLTGPPWPTTSANFLSLMRMISEIFLLPRRLHRHRLEQALGESHTAFPRTSVPPPLNSNVALH